MAEPLGLPWAFLQPCSAGEGSLGQPLPQVYVRWSQGTRGCRAREMLLEARAGEEEPAPNTSRAAEVVPGAWALSCAAPAWRLAASMVFTRFASKPFIYFLFFPSVSFAQSQHS